LPKFRVDGDDLLAQLVRVNRALFRGLLVSLDQIGA
jgi:hypothetical protein